MSRAMSFKHLAVLPSDDFCLVLHASESPSDEAWTRYADAMAALADKRGGTLGHLPTLVLSDGGGPTAIQRARITEEQEKRGSTARVSVIADTAFLRGTVRLVAMFNPKLRAFAPREFEAAIAHLGVPASEGATIKREILLLEQEMGVKLRVVRSLFARKA